MKRILWTFLALAAAFLFSLLPTTSYAQTPAPPAPSASEPLPFSLPDCVPTKYFGTGKGFLTKDSGAGVWRGWWCPTPDGKWVMWKHVVLNAYKTQAVNKQANDAMDSGVDLLDTLKRAVSATTIAPSAADILAYNTLHLEAQTALLAVRPPDAAASASPPPPPPPPPPPAYTWFIKFNASFSGTPNTSPVYSLSGGVRGAAISGARVEFDTPCKPEAASAPSGTSTTQQYAAFAPLFDPTRVGLCVKHATTP